MNFANLQRFINQFEVKQIYTKNSQPHKIRWRSQSSRVSIHSVSQQCGRERAAVGERGGEREVLEREREAARRRQLSNWQLSQCAGVDSLAVRLFHLPRVAHVPNVPHVPLTQLPACQGLLSNNSKNNSNAPLGSSAPIPTITWRFGISPFSLRYKLRLSLCSILRGLCCCSQGGGKGGVQNPETVPHTPTLPLSLLTLLWLSFRSITNRLSLPALLLMQLHLTLVDLQRE